MFSAMPLGEESPEATTVVSPVDRFTASIRPACASPTNAVFPDGLRANPTGKLKPRAMRVTLPVARSIAASVQGSDSLTYAVVPEASIATFSCGVRSPYDTMLVALVSRLTADIRPPCHSEMYATDAQEAGSLPVGRVLSARENSRSLPPLFETVRVWSWRVVLNSVAESWAGCAPITGATSPCPRSAIDTNGVSGSLLAMTRAPVTRVAAIGVKVTVTVAVVRAGMVSAEADGENSPAALVIDWSLSGSLPRL